VLFVVVTMLVVLVVAGLVVVYVAFPHRGAKVPSAPWLGEMMNRAAGAAPVLEPEDARHHEDAAYLRDARHPEYEDSERRR
jgi:hypothetical protein